MGEDQLVAAQMAFQERLAAFHSAEAHLAELDARLRRMEVEREVFGRADPIDQAEVEAQRDQQRAEVERCRTAARQAHTVLRQLSGPGAEPDDVITDTDDEGYHQPPYTESL